MLTRRTFVAAIGATVASGLAGAASSEALGAQRAQGDVTAAGRQGGYFLEDTLTRPRYRTAAAICSRLLPTGQSAAHDPGAAEAGAVSFIDLFLGAFELPDTVADGPLIFLQGRFSGRNPYPDERRGAPSQGAPADELGGASGRPRRSVPLTPSRELAWRYRLYGREALKRTRAHPQWMAQLGTLNPTPPPLRQLYLDGLDAFESFARQLFDRSFHACTAAEQDLMLQACGDPAISASPRSIPEPPAPARTLFPYIVTHTLQGCFALPEYGGNRDAAMWRWLGWEGDTQPLGNSVYQPGAAAPGQGPNRGFGDPSVYEPQGSVREYRPVSEPEGTTGATTGPIAAAGLLRGLSRPQP
ncbi:MAG: gluconate 2-dehydrogenase subunit 3 family protein [Acidimicrobiales bacterium]